MLKVPQLGFLIPPPVTSTDHGHMTLTLLPCPTLGPFHGHPGSCHREIRHLQFLKMAWWREEGTLEPFLGLG